MPISITEARALYDAGAPVARVADQLGVSLRAFRDLRIANGWPLREPVAKPAQAGAHAIAKPRRAAGAKTSPKGKKSSRQAGRGSRAAVKPAPGQRARARAQPPAKSPRAPRVANDETSRDTRQDPAPAGAPVDARALRRQLEGRLHREISSAGARLASASDDAAERAARTLASLVKSLAELRRLETLDPSTAGQTGDADACDERPPRDLDTLREELARALERLSPA